MKIIKPISILMGLIFAVVMAQATPSYTFFNAASTGDTYAYAIDGSGNIGGLYVVSNSWSTFYKPTSGSVVLANFASESSPEWPYGAAMNSSGVMVGRNFTNPGYQGWRSSGGTITTYQLGDGGYTYTNGITSTSTSNTVGQYVNGGVAHGYFLTSGGTLPINIDYPSAASTAVTGVTPNSTYLYGYYFASGGIASGFIYNTGTSTFTNFRPSGVSLVVPTDGSNSRIVGYFYFGATPNTSHGFSYDISTATWTQYDAPDAGTYGTSISGVNSSGDMCGWYNNSGTNDNPLVINSGTITEFYPTGCNSGDSAAARDIDDSGDVIGSCMKGTRVQGWERTP